MPGPADVWALSKTLWVLLTGETFPLPGPHRPSDPAYALRERIIFNYAGELDLLLENSTRIDPTSREWMADFARELRACLAPPPETSASSTLPELRDRITALTTIEHEQASAARKWNRQVDRVYGELEGILNETNAELIALLPNFSISPGKQARGPALIDPPNAATGPEWGRWSQGRMLRSPGKERKVAVTVTIGTRIMQQNDPIEIAATLRVETLGPTDLPLEIDSIWVDSYTVPIGSAQQSQALASIHADFRSSFDTALRRVAEILNASL